MIERKFVADKIKEFEIQKHIQDNLKRVGHSHTKLVKTPLGEKIVIYSSRPGLVVGKKGESIKKLTKVLKKKYSLENPQVEISEIKNPNLSSTIVAERIANSLERFGTSKFKAIGHKTMSDVMSAGALGVEILISGKIPSSRSKTWRFYQGYLKKCGEIAMTGVDKAYTQAVLKTGIVGVKVSIMPPSLRLPDDIREYDEEAMKEAALKKAAEVEEKKPKKKAKKRKTATKKAVKKDDPKSAPKTESQPDKEEAKKEAAPKVEEKAETQEKSKESKSSESTEEVVEEKKEEKSE